MLSSIRGPSSCFESKPSFLAYATARQFCCQIHQSTGRCVPSAKFSWVLYGERTRISYNEPLAGSTTSTDQAIHALRTLLRGDGRTVDERWRTWARELIDMYELSPQLIVDLWQEVLDFDRTLASYITEPIPLDVPAVVVAGSGKETFKTFNVSTAASILAAASGAYVVKGVSRSVSAVSGSADVLDVLGRRSPTCRARCHGRWNVTELPSSHTRRSVPPTPVATTAFSRS